MSDLKGDYSIKRRIVEGDIQLKAASDDGGGEKDVVVGDGRWTDGGCLRCSLSAGAAPQSEQRSGGPLSKTPGHSS